MTSVGDPRDRDLARFLDDLGSDYDQWEGGLQRDLAMRLATLVSPEPGNACLDIGTGTGVVTHALSERVGPSGSVVSIDIPVPTLQEASHGLVGGNTSVANMRGDALPIRDATFDVVTLSRSIAYEGNIRGVLSEARRTLRHGGRIAMFCRRRGLATSAERRFLTALAGLAERASLRIPSVFLDYPGIADRDEIRELLIDVGFSDVKFSDFVTGGCARNASEWNDVMTRCWPAALILIGGLGSEALDEFNRTLDERMTDLGDDAYRYHHPYLFAVARPNLSVQVGPARNE